MRSLVLLLVVTFPYLAAATVPSTHKARIAAADRTIRISLINFSSHSRQLRLKSGLVELPSGQRIDIDARVGATLLVISSNDLSLHEEIQIAAGDDHRIISVQ